MDVQLTAADINTVAVALQGWIDDEHIGDQQSNARFDMVRDVGDKMGMRLHRRYGRRRDAAGF